MEKKDYTFVAVKSKRYVVVAMGMKEYRLGYVEEDAFDQEVVDILHDIPTISGFEMARMIRNGLNLLEQERRNGLNLLEQD